MMSTYADSVTVDSWLGPKGLEVETHLDVRTWYVRPDKFRLEYRAEARAGSGLFVSDGHDTFRYSDAGWLCNKYPDWASAFAGAVGATDAAAQWVLTLLGAAPREDVDALDLRDLSVSTRAGSTLVSGNLSYAPYEKLTLEIDERTRLLRRISGESTLTDEERWKYRLERGMVTDTEIASRLRTMPTAPSSEGKPTRFAFRQTLQDVHVDEQIPSQTFRFVPPQGVPCLEVKPP